MGSVFKRGRKLWLKYKDADGEWVSESSGFDVGEEKAARKALAQMETRVEVGLDAGGVLTVRTFANRWLKERKAQGVSSTGDDKSRLDNHVLPHIGDVQLVDVTPRHIRDIVRGMKVKVDGKLAPRTQRNIYAVMHRLFADAVDDDLIDVTPCKVRRRDLPVARDQDPLWRTQAVFSRREVEQLISDSRLPEERRVLHTIMFLTGMRFGEVAALRWCHWDSTLEPLGRLLVAVSYSIHHRREKGVKTDTTRKVPVHPVLARVLNEWRLGGWARMVGRQPTADDLLMPDRQGKHRNVRDNLEAFRLACKRLGLRDDRRQHDTRRTFVSLAQDDGATEARLRWITHGRKHGVMGLYDQPAWKALCEEMLKLQIRPLTSAVVELPKAVAIGQREQRDLGTSGFGTVLGTVSDFVSERCGIKRSLMVTPQRDSNLVLLGDPPTGLEPCVAW